MTIELGSEAGRTRPTGDGREESVNGEDMFMAEFAQ